MHFTIKLFRASLFEFLTGPNLPYFTHQVMWNNSYVQWFEDLVGRAVLFGTCRVHSGCVQ